MLLRVSAFVLFLSCAACLQAEDLPLSKTFMLWPQGAPGALGDAPEDKPTLTHYPPSERFKKKAAVIICPGGGYGGHAMGHEGTEIAGWVTSMRMDAFVLKYRLGKNYPHPAPMQDVRRAIQHVRANAEEYGIDPAKIGVVGFSAGGHLASTAATHILKGDEKASDPVEQVTSRPDFAILCYPVISMQDGVTHGGSKRNLLGTEPGENEVKLMSNDQQVSAETPPTFLFHTYEDSAVLPINSVLFYRAMIKNGVPGELHIFQKGRHGVGLGKGIVGTEAWSGLAELWLRTNGFVSE